MTQPVTRTPPDAELARLAREAWELLGAAWLNTRGAMLAATASEGLTFAQAKALLHLDPAAPAAMRDLARELQCDASHVTAVADRLEELGYARRRPSAVDRRIKELVVTASGRAAMARLRRAMFTPPPGLVDLPERDLRFLRRIAGHLAGRLGVDPENPFAASREPTASP